MVYLTSPGQTISKTALRDFRNSTLDRDDIFQAEFFSNVVFYGSEEEDLQIESDALEELAVWNVATKNFVVGKKEARVAPRALRICRRRKDLAAMESLLRLQFVLHDFVQAFSG